MVVRNLAGLLSAAAVAACAAGGVGGTADDTKGLGDGSGGVAGTSGDGAPPTSAGMTWNGSASSDAVDSGGSGTADPRTDSTGNECSENTECPTGLCVDGACDWATDCADLSSKSPMLQSGEYEIDPDGPAGGFDAFPIYCDMLTDGGGWTLVMKATNGTNTLGFASSFWTTTDTLNADQTMPNVAPTGQNAKYASFNRVSGGSLRLEWLDTVLMGHAFNYHELGGQTALELFQGDELLVTGNEAVACAGDAFVDADGYIGTAMRHGRGRQFHGINGTDAGQDGSNAGMRFGFGSNDEDYNSWAPKQAIGAGAASLIWADHADCNNCGCYGTSHVPAEISANLWVR